MHFLTQRRNLYYGWTIAVTLAITETISWGIIYYAFSVFLTPMEADLHWSRAELTGGFSLALLVMGGMAFPVGTWVDRHGSRFLMTSGSILASLLVIAWSLVTDRSLFYLIWVGLGVCGAAVLYDPAFAVIAHWFIRRRSTALAVITFAAGFASTIFIPLSDALLHSFGWRGAVLRLGIFLAVSTIPLHALVLRRRPADLNLLPDGDTESIAHAAARSSASLAEALHSRYFWLMILAFSLSTIAVSAIRVHFIPFLIDWGIDPSTAALASGSIGIMQVAGRAVFAPLDTRFSARTMVMGMFVMQAIAMMVLLLGASPIVVLMFIVVFGTSYGAQTLARVSMIAQQFGASNYGRIASVMTIFLTLAGTAAPVGAAALHDRYGNYQLVVWLVIALAMAAAGVVIFAMAESRR